jgi:hypothetical protein
MAVIEGHIVRTPGEKLPYKVVLLREGNQVSEHPVASIREGEALIRDRLPQPLQPQTQDDWHD